MDGGQRRFDAQLNVLGDPITSCSHDPVTGFFRDGCKSWPDFTQTHLTRAQIFNCAQTSPRARR